MASKMLASSLASSLSGTRLLQQTPAAQRVGVPAARRTVVVAEAQEVQERLPVAVAGLSLASTALAAPAAHAEDATVDQAVASVVDIVKATGEVVKQGVSAAQTGAEYAKAAYDQVAPVVKTAVDAAAPVVVEGVKTAVEVATPAVKTGLEEAGKVLSATGVPSLDSKAAEPIKATTEQAVTISKPLLEQFLTFLTTTEPALLGQYALGLVAAYYLAPPVLKASAGLLRGYAGDVTATAALTVVEGNGNAVIVDIRSVREKELAGLPDIPNSSQLLELEYAAIEDKRVRGQLKNVGDLEVKVTALQISALKRLSRGADIFIMDRSGSGVAKAVAKALSARGFPRVFVIKGGFQGWQACKLRVKAGNYVSRVEVIQPSTTFFGTGSTRDRSRSPTMRARSPVAGRVKTVSSGSMSQASGRRALPSQTGQ